MASKRLRTEADNAQDDSNCVNGDNSYLRLMQEYAEENRKLKQELKRKKKCVEVRAEDLVAIISQYNKLKAKTLVM
jgi:precorrin-3B methylase